MAFQPAARIRLSAPVAVMGIVMVLAEVVALVIVQAYARLVVAVFRLIAAKRTPFRMTITDQVVAVVSHNTDNLYRPSYLNNNREAEKPASLLFDKQWGIKHIYLT